MASNGLTAPGAIIAIRALLGITVYGKIHLGDAEDGTMNPSSITARTPMNFSDPDANGMADLTAKVSWGVFAVSEAVWGVSLWTSLTAGQCIYIREFDAVKNQVPGDNLDLVTLPIKFKIVGQ